MKQRPRTSKTASTPPPDVSPAAVSDAQRERLLRPENLAKLGTVPDYALSEALGVPLPEIRAQRELRGIPRFVAPTHVPHEWKPDELRLLGTMTDTAVAHKLGISELQAETERRRRHIPPVKAHIQCHDWLPRHDAMLGVKTDAMIAVELGLTTQTVAARRNELGIPRQRTSGMTKGGHVHRKPEEIWTPEAIAKLGTVSDSTLAPLLRIPSADVRAKREALGIPRREPKHPATRDWTPEELALLGTMTDADLAKKLGVNRSRVAMRRVRLGIPVFDPGKTERQWTGEEDAMLGVRVDTEVAVLLRIPRRTVAARRKKLGIPRQYGNRSRMKAHSPSSSLSDIAHARNFCDSFNMRTPKTAWIPGIVVWQPRLPIKIKQAFDFYLTDCAGSGGFWVPRAKRNWVLPVLSHLIATSTYFVTVRPPTRAVRPV